jgi:hypothetical protein
LIIVYISIRISTLLPVCFSEFNTLKVISEKEFLPKKGTLFLGITGQIVEELIYYPATLIHDLQLVTNN